MQELHALIQQNVTDKVRDQVMDDYYSQVLADFKLKFKAWLKSGSKKAAVKQQSMKVWSLKDVGLESHLKAE